VPLPLGMKVRPATINDLNAVLNVRAANNIADWGVSTLTMGELKTSWKQINLEADTRVVETAGEVIAYAQVYGAGEPSPLLYVAVPPENRGKGVGTYLLQVMEAQALSAMTTVPAGKTRSFAAQISGRNTMAQRVLEKHGYQFIRAFDIMELTMHEEPPSPQNVMGVEVRRFIPGKDEQAVYEADEEAFQDEWGKTPRTYKQWSRRLNLHSGFDASLWFVAWDEGQVAGSVMAEVEHGKGRIHHLSVRRPWRRRGLGMALLQQTMRAFWRRGVRTLVLNVDATSLTNANMLYERAGFRVVNEYLNYRKLI
jgi:mycothiol synthase